MLSSCPICMQEHPKHKLDCPNGAYVRMYETEIAELKDAIGKLRDYWVYREDRDYYRGLLGECDPQHGDWRTEVQ